MNGLEELKKIEDSYREQKGKLLNDPFIHLHERMWFMAVEKELKDYHEIKEIAKRYHFDDLARDTHMTTTDEKYLRLFNAAIPDIQADYRKARAFDTIKSHAKEIKHFKYLLYMARYWEENRVEITEELLYNYDFPYTVDEFRSLKEALR